MRGYDEFIKQASLSTALHGMGQKAKINAQIAGLKLRMLPITIKAKHYAKKQKNNNQNNNQNNASEQSAVGQPLNNTPGTLNKNNQTPI